MAPESVQKLVNKLSHQRDIKINYQLLKGANHFFNDKMPELEQVISDYLDANLERTLGPRNR